MAKDNNNDKQLPLTKRGICLLLGGLGLMVLGYILMSGGKITDPEVFNPEMFSFTRLTIAPILILAGIGVEIYAIFSKK